MPLKKGLAYMKSNYKELTQNPVQSASRQKAIQTIAKSRGISKDEAKHVQALAIIKAKARQK